jgi:hypothetical protein
MIRPQTTPNDAGDREDWLATASTYASELTEAGARCHLNDGQRKFCLWQAMELDGHDPSGDPAPMVGVRCTVHEGGRCLDADARPDLADFA